MPIDPFSLAIGTVVALVPLLAGLWSLQRRLARAQGEQALLQERLEHAQLSQAGLLAQLDDCRAELA
ncbi:MAG: DNA recombination protein RmuC, partial [Ectopseudomonas oleovorans]